MAEFGIGVDLGGTNLRVAAVTADGRLLEKITTGTQVARGRDRVVTEMCGDIQQLATKLASAGSMAGIGIGIPGIIDLHTGFIHESPNLPGWENYPVRDEIERRLGARVILENDANAAALGEKWQGAGRDHDDLVMLTLGTGVGGGIILGGRIWHGMTGMAGELGHFSVDAEGPQCGCGNRGCLEQLASATAIVRMAREASAGGNAPALQKALDSDPEFSSKVVYQMAIQGDEPSRAIYRRVGRSLAVIVGGIVNALNVPMVVIGGGVSSAWEAFSPTLFADLKWRSFVYRATAPAESGKIEPGTTIVTRALLGSDAGLYGAARLPMLNGGAEKMRTSRQK